MWSVIQLTSVVLLVEPGIITVQTLVLFVLRDAKYALQILNAAHADNNTDFQALYVSQPVNILVLVVLILQEQHAYHAMVDTVRMEINATLTALVIKQHASFVLEDSTYQIKENVSNVLCLQIV